MPATKVGSHQFREKLATPVVHAQGSVSIPRHSDAVGYVFPPRPKRTEADRRRFQELADKIDRELAARGITEEEIYADIDLVLKGKHR